MKEIRYSREFFSEADVFQKFMDIAFADITDYVSFGQQEVPVMGMYGPLKEKDPETGKRSRSQERKTLFPPDHLKRWTDPWWQR